jgi:thioredoxin reductase
MSTEGAYEVIVVGGGAAGLSAALFLGRVRRRVLVCDAGEPRNASAGGVHGFLSREGMAPSELLGIGREQLGSYGTVEVSGVEVIDAEGEDGGFRASLADGTLVRCRNLVLATGVRDVMPEIEGIEDFWGRSVAHCPYCHGFELRDESLAVYGANGDAVSLVVLLTRLSSDLVLLTDGSSAIGKEEMKKLAALGVGIRKEKISRLEGEDGRLRRILFENGEEIERRGLFLRPGRVQRSDLARKLGCRITGEGVVEADADGSTNVPGLYVAGDAMHPRHRHLLISAALSGATSAMAINSRMLGEELESRLTAVR